MKIDNIFIRNTSLPNQCLFGQMFLNPHDGHLGNFIGKGEDEPVAVDNWHLGYAVEGKSLSAV
jgi:hypothetical protein